MVLRNTSAGPLRMPFGPWIPVGEKFVCEDEEQARRYIDLGLAEPVEGESPPPETETPETPERGGDE